MSAATMLVVIAAVVAALAFSASVLIWIAHPVETSVASCGTLRSPMNPVLVARPVAADALEGDVEAALAPSLCTQAHSQVRYSQQLALASGGVASATAIGAWAAGRREQRLVASAMMVDAGGREVEADGLAGYSLPGRPDPQIEGPDAPWST